MTNPNKPNLTALIALSSLLAFYPGKFCRILQDFDDPADFFKLPAAERKQKYDMTLGDTRPILEEADKQLQQLLAAGIQFTVLGDDAFPFRLTEHQDLPPFLYVRSDTNVRRLFNRASYTAIVGTRDISPYGTDVTSQLIHDLSLRNPDDVVVSGLALGVDATAHRFALEAGLRTIAVLPTDILNVYPLAHRTIAQQIASQPDGALVSPFAPNTPPLAINFLYRNRILAAFASRTIVVQTKQKGGAMITARLAASYGRDVFAVPGRIDDPRSQGCNELIREGVARCYTRIEQIA